MAFKCQDKDSLPGSLVPASSCAQLPLCMQICFAFPIVPLELQWTCPTRNSCSSLPDCLLWHLGVQALCIHPWGLETQELFLVPAGHPGLTFKQLLMCINPISPVCLQSSTLKTASFLSFSPSACAVGLAGSLPGGFQAPNLPALTCSQFTEKTEKMLVSSCPASDGSLWP